MSNRKWDPPGDMYSHKYDGAIVLAIITASAAFSLIGVACIGYHITMWVFS